MNPQQEDNQINDWPVDTHWESVIKETDQFDDGEAFTRGVVSRWQRELEQPVAGRIGKRAIFIAAGWAALLAVIIGIGQMNLTPETVTPPPPAVGQLVREMGNRYIEPSQRIGEVVGKSAHYMDWPNVVNLINNEMSNNPMLIVPDEPSNDTEDEPSSNSTDVGI